MFVIYDTWEILENYSQPDIFSCLLVELKFK